MDAHGATSPGGTRGNHYCASQGILHLAITCISVCVNPQSKPITQISPDCTCHCICSQLLKASFLATGRSCMATVEICSLHQLASQDSICNQVLEVSIVAICRCCMVTSVCYKMTSLTVRYALPVPMEWSLAKPGNGSEIRCRFTMLCKPKLSNTLLS